MRRYKMTDSNGKKYYVFAISVYRAMQIVLALHKDVTIISVVSN